ncbi:MAG: MerR family transcriptional regulator [Prevotellaceae bacterium]|nr:MerR family transcriptional regulator [Prevotellaceae bacterium]
MNEKMYYTIGEVAELLSESTSLVRFWSQKFPAFIKPIRNKKGNRLFTVSDVENYKVIYHLVKERGMTLDGAAKRMANNKEGFDKSMDVIASLRRIRDELEEIRETL